MKISVIVPFYNGERYLSACIESILNQSFRDFELLLIDDGSTDGSKAICEKWIEIDARICLFSQEHAGVSAARNKGLKECIGEHICFVDADDMLKADFLYKMDQLLEDGNVGMGICQFEWDGSRAQSRREYDGNDCVNRMLESSVLLNSIILDREIGGYVWNKIFRHRLIQEYGLAFQEDIGICEDMLFVFTYVKKISKAAFLGEELYFYRSNPDSACHRRNYYTYRGHLTAIEKVLFADIEQTLSVPVIRNLQKSYAAEGVRLNIDMFCEGLYDKAALRYQLMCAKRFYPMLSMKYKMGYCALKIFPKLIFLFCKVFGYKITGKKT